MTATGLHHMGKTVSVCVRVRETVSIAFVTTQLEGIATCVGERNYDRRDRLSAAGVRKNLHQAKLAPRAVK